MRAGRHQGLRTKNNNKQLRNLQAQRRSATDLQARRRSATDHCPLHADHRPSLSLSRAAARRRSRRDRATSHTSTLTFTRRSRADRSHRPGRRTTNGGGSLIREIAGRDTANSTKTSDSPLRSSGASRQSESSLPGIFGINDECGASCFVSQIRRCQSALNRLGKARPVLRRGRRARGGAAARRGGASCAGYSSAADRGRGGSRPALRRVALRPH